jgi:hypothetical protein
MIYLLATPGEMPCFYLLAGKDPLSMRKFLIATLSAALVFIALWLCLCIYLLARKGKP